MHQRHKFLRANASRNNLKFRVSEMAFPGVFKRYFPLQMPCCFVKATKTGNDAVDVSQTFQDIAWFEHFTDVNLLNMRSMSFDGAYFLLAVIIEGDEGSQLRMAN